MLSSKAARDRFREWLRDTAEAKFDFDVEIANLTNRSVSGIRNEIPPFEFWPNIIPTLRILELVRQKFGPTTINSAYRSPAYNSALSGSASESQHVQFRAIDFRCSSGSPREWATFLNQLRQEGTFKGGIGTYRSFVHVDTRGTNATW